MLIKTGRVKFGKTRTEQAKNLYSEGWGTGFKRVEDADKAKHLERRGIRFPNASQIERVK